MATYVRRPPVANPNLCRTVNWRRISWLGGAGFTHSAELWAVIHDGHRRDGEARAGGSPFRKLGSSLRRPARRPRRGLQWRQRFIADSFWQEVTLGAHTGVRLRLGAEFAESGPAPGFIESGSELSCEQLRGQLVTRFDQVGVRRPAGIGRPRTSSAVATMLPNDLAWWRAIVAM